MSVRVGWWMLRWVVVSYRVVWEGKASLKDLLSTSVKEWSFWVFDGRTLKASTPCEDYVSSIFKNSKEAIQLEVCRQGDECWGRMSERWWWARAWSTMNFKNCKCRAKLKQFYSENKYIHHLDQSVKFYGTSFISHPSLSTHFNIYLTWIF